MVKVNHSWLSQQHSYRQLPDLNCMNTLLETKQREGSEPNLRSPNLGTNFPKNFEAPVPNPSLHDNGKEFAYGFSGMAVPKAYIFGLSQKRFLIFDQSENHTRLTYNYVWPNPVIPNRSAEESHKWGISEVDQTDRTDDVSVEESDGDEDTDEINALLDSDDSDSESGEDDEVTSTARYPIQIQAKESCPTQKRPHELTEEVASSDGPNKRQKIVDGEYNKSLVNEHENDAKSSCAEVEGSECTFRNTRFEKEKIREILRVLESVIPGVKGMEPLLVIDEAIDYLRFAKAEAQGLIFH